MFCEQTNCQLNVFNTCQNHCSKNLCLQHFIEHDDLFLKNFTVALDHLENTSKILLEQLTLASTQIDQRRQNEFERINRIHQEKQYHLRQQNTFAERTDRFIEEKNEQLKQSQNDSICRLNQHDFEQLKIYARQIDQYLIKDERKSSNLIEKIVVKPKAISENSSVVCPLTRPNVFGIRPEHDLRFDCEGGFHTKFTLVQHCEYYHRMLTDCAVRLRDAIFAGYSSDTPIFSADEILKNEEYFVNCPLTNPNNVFGALGAGRTLRCVPCSKKGLSLSSLRGHFTGYHRMNFDAARKLFLAIKMKKMPDDEILFEPDDNIGCFHRKV